MKKQGLLDKLLTYSLSLSILYICARIAFWGDNSLARLYNLNQQKNRLQTQNRSLMIKNEELEVTIDDLNTDKKKWIQIARDEHNMINPKKDVKIIKFVDSEDSE